MAKKNTNTYTKKKSVGLRVFIVLIAAALLLGIVIMPIASSAEEDGVNITVQSFETGKLSEALSEAADGTDYNFIKNVAVLSGTLNAEDYAALTAIPNLEILELAKAETENGVIPENALTSRNQLSLITLPKNTVEIGNNAFSSNRKLIKVSMPSTVTKIGDYAFAACESMTDIPVSEAVTYIGEGAFQDCKSLTEFVIPSGITVIYPNTFSKCGFENISVGPNITEIGDSAFADCNALKDIYVYGKEAPVLGSDVFRNVGASVHCCEESEESYKSWAQNNMSVSADLTGEYVLSAEVTEENNETYETSAEASDEANTDNESSADVDSAAEEETSEETAEETAAAESANVSSSGGVGVGTVVVIVIMAVVIAVLATMLIMTKKGQK